MFGWRKNRAAKQYARQLGPWLTRSYGRRKVYTVQQIRMAVQRLALPSKYVCLGYASFLSEDHYQALVPELPYQMPYGEARALVARFTSATQCSLFSPAGDNPYVMSGGDFS